jgi:hypothetical protein
VLRPVRLEMPAAAETTTIYSAALIFVSFYIHLANKKLFLSFRKFRKRIKIIKGGNEFPD